MKKIYTLILTLILSFSLTGCSSIDKASVLDFFKSLNTTLTADSGHFTGNISIRTKDDSDFSFELDLNQKSDLNLACKIDLKAGNQEQEDFINFYIKDGKTYLNMLGTTSQSLASNIGFNPGDKINVYNPFLNYTDKELISFFKSAKKDNNTYLFNLDTKKLGIFLDSMGSISVSEAEIRAEEKNGMITSFDLHIKMTQNIKEEFKTDFTIHIDAKDLNNSIQIPFPEDLESY